jgi:NitT/TauT family transport system substrate-binding protein
MFITTRRSIAVGAAALLLVATAACGTSGENKVGAEGLTTVTVGTSPIVDMAGLQFAVDKGYFSAEGLKVNLVNNSAGAAVTNLVNGSLDVALGETALLVEAFDKGLPVRIKAVATKTTDDPTKDTGTVLVAKNSPIKTPADLNGKTVAVGSLKGGGELSLRAALDKDGADSNKVKFLEMPLPDMTAALERGRVDAISTISPFDQAALAAGATRLMSPGAEAAPHAMQVAVATSMRFETEHAAALKEFLSALDEGTAYAAGHPNDVRAILPTFSPVPKALIAKMQLPVFDSSDPRAALKIWTDLMEQYKFVSKPVDIDKLMS